MVEYFAVNYPGCDVEWITGQRIKVGAAAP